MGGANDNPTEEDNLDHAEVVEEISRDVDASGHWPGDASEHASATGSVVGV